MDEYEIHLGQLLVTKYFLRKLIGTVVGVFTLHGILVGLAAQQSYQWNAWTIMPEVDYTHLAQGITIRSNKTTNISGGVTFCRPQGG